MIVFQQKSGAFPLFSVVISYKTNFLILTAGKTVKFHQNKWWNLCFIVPEIEECQEDTMSKVPSVIEELVTPIVEELNLELVNVEFVKEGRDWFLRVYVDTPEGGIDISQCAQVSERLSLLLDEKDPITQNYYLEVSSPGAERPLKKDTDFEKAIGKFIYVKTYEPIKDMKEFLGYLTSYDEHTLVMDVRIKTRKITVTIEQKEIALARLAIDFSA